MFRRLTDWLACPRCGGSLALIPESTGSRTDPVLSGILQGTACASYGVLKPYGKNLELLTESGWSWTHPLLRFFLKVLLALHGFIPNYGLVIIVFTILVEIVLFPLTLQSLRAAKKMQKLGPKMNQIREQFKKDPGRMNKETMALYQKEKVNPFGGCLPMLLQLALLRRLLLRAPELDPAASAAVLRVDHRSLPAGAAVRDSRDRAPRARPAATSGR